MVLTVKDTLDWKRVYITNYELTHQTASYVLDLIVTARHRKEVIQLCVGQLNELTPLMRKYIMHLELCSWDDTKIIVELF